MTPISHHSIPLEFVGWCSKMSFVVCRPENYCHISITKLAHASFHTKVWNPLVCCLLTLCLILWDAKAPPSSLPSFPYRHRELKVSYPWLSECLPLHCQKTMFKCLPVSSQMLTSLEGRDAILFIFIFYGWAR